MQIEIIRTEHIPSTVARSSLSSRDLRDAAIADITADAYRITLKDQAQHAEVLIQTDGESAFAGVAWGGDATWIELGEDDGPEEAVRRVLEQTDP